MPSATLWLSGAKLEPVYHHLTGQLSVDRSHGRQIVVLTQDEVLYERLAAGLVAGEDYRLLQLGRTVEDVYRLAGQGTVDVLLLDARLHAGATPALIRSMGERLPGVPLALLANPMETDLIRQALTAGARSFLPLDFAPASLAQLVDDLTRRGAAEPQGGAAKHGHVLVLFSLKGGVGRTLLATNLAVALRAATDSPVVLVDGQILHGDTEIDLNLKPQHCIADLASQVDHLEPDLIDAALVQHASGVRVLAACDSAEQAEAVQPRHLARILAALRLQYRWVVVDTGNTADDRMDAMLDAADTVLLLTTPEFPALRATRLFLEAARQQAYPQEKMRLVVNRADLLGGVPAKEIERNLGLPVSAKLPDDSPLVTLSVNRGVPLVTSHPRKPLARAITGLAAETVAAMEPAEATRRRSGPFSLGRGG